MNTDDVFLREALKAKEAECERLADQVKRQAEEIESLRTQVAEAREALGFYARAKEYNDIPFSGEIARAALAKLEGEP